MFEWVSRIPHNYIRNASRIYSYIVVDYLIYGQAITFQITKPFFEETPHCVVKHNSRMEHYPRRNRNSSLITIQNDMFLEIVTEDDEAVLIIAICFIIPWLCEVCNVQYMNG